MRILFLASLLLLPSFANAQLSGQTPPLVQGVAVLTEAMDIESPTWAHCSRFQSIDIGVSTQCDTAYYGQPYVELSIPNQDVYLGYGWNDTWLDNRYLQLPSTFAFLSNVVFNVPLFDEEDNITGQAECWYNVTFDLDGLSPELCRVTSVCTPPTVENGDGDCVCENGAFPVEDPETGLPTCGEDPDENPACFIPTYEPTSSWSDFSTALEQTEIYTAIGILGSSFSPPQSGDLDSPLIWNILVCDPLEPDSFACKYTEITIDLESCNSVVCPLDVIRGIVIASFGLFLLALFYRR